MTAKKRKVAVRPTKTARKVDLVKEQRDIAAADKLADERCRYAPRAYVPLVNTPQPCCDQCGEPTVINGLCETDGCPNDIQHGL